MLNYSWNITCDDVTPGEVNAWQSPTIGATNCQVNDNFHDPSVGHPQQRVAAQAMFNAAKRLFSFSCQEKIGALNSRFKGYVRQYSYTLTPDIINIYQ